MYEQLMDKIFTYLESNQKASTEADKVKQNDREKLLQ